MTQINLNATLASNDSNVLDRVRQLSEIGEDLQNQIEMLAEQGMSVTFSDNGDGELVIDIQPETNE